MTYASRQDFAATMASLACDSPYLRTLLTRSVANDSDQTFKRHLHDAMGYKKSTVEDALY